MSDNPLNTPILMISNRCQQDTAATTRPYQSLSRMGWVDYRIGRPDRTGERHTEPEQEVARTMLTLRRLVLFSTKAHATEIPLNMSGPVIIHDNDGERTITAGPTSDTTSTRHDMTSASIAMKSAPGSNVGATNITATEDVTIPAVRKITLEEYIRLRKARKDREAHDNA